MDSGFHNGSAKAVRYMLSLAADLLLAELYLGYICMGFRCG